MHDIVIVGGGGHCRVLIEAVRAACTFKVIGIVDSRLAVGTLVDGVPVLGDDTILATLAESGVVHAIVGVGSVGDPGARVRVAEKIEQAGLVAPGIVHPAAYIASGAQVEPGAFVAAVAVVGTGARVGRFAIVNSGAVVDHDCGIGEFVHIAPGCALSGNVVVGRGSHLGTGSSVIQGVTIGSGSIVGAGSVVVDDVPDNVIAYGNPCRVARSLA